MAMGNAQNKSGDSSENIGFAIAPCLAVSNDVGINMSNTFFDHPILISPYECPQRHWELDAQGQPLRQGHARPDFRRK
jgi:hypothetical protein